MRLVGALTRGIRCVVSSAERLTLPRQAYDSDERCRNFMTRVSN